MIQVSYIGTWTSVVIEYGREADESEPYLGTKVDNIWWMNGCNMEVGQGNMEDTYVNSQHSFQLGKTRSYYSQVREHKN